MLVLVFWLQLLLRVKTEHVSCFNIVVVTVNISMRVVLHIVLHSPRIAISCQHINNGTNLAIHPLTTSNCIVNSIVHDIHSNTRHT